MNRFEKPKPNQIRDGPNYDIRSTDLPTSVAERVNSCDILPRLQRIGYVGPLRQTSRTAHVEMKLAGYRKRVLDLAQIDCDYSKLARILQNEPITCYQRKLVELGSGHMKGVEIVKSPRSSVTRVQSHGFNGGFDRCGQDLVRYFPKIAQKFHCYLDGRVAASQRRD